MFFLSYFEFSQNQHQHKFWTLSAIIDVLSVSLSCGLQNLPHPVNLSLCRSVLLDLLRSKGAEVLNQLTIPKFAKMFILLLKLDNLAVDALGNPSREWQSAITDLVGLPQTTAEVEQ